MFSYCLSFKMSRLISFLIAHAIVLSLYWDSVPSPAKGLSSFGILLFFKHVLDAIENIRNRKYNIKTYFTYVKIGFQRTTVLWRGLGQSPIYRSYIKFPKATWRRWVRCFWSWGESVSRMECIAQIGIPRSTVGIPRLAAMREPTVLPEGMSEREAKSW